MGDTVCVEILIINDFVLEGYEENFFVNITSNDANISPGSESATILIQDSDQGIYYHVNSCTLYCVNVWL